MSVPPALAPHLGEGITRWEAASLMELRSSAPDAFEALREAVDALGVASGVAQNLKGPLTSVAKLVEMPGQRLYLLRAGARVSGLVKVGEKHLYYWRRGGGAQVELDPRCVLDFYVVAQRRGDGKRVFDAMCAAERAEPREFAYDRPSPKMLPFLARHFGLTAFAEQPNNFVVFDAFFSDRSAMPPRDPPRRLGGTADRVVGTM